MRQTKQGYKELLDNSANLIISDNLSTKELRLLAQYAFEKGRSLTIRSSYKNLEDLKKIASEGKGFVTIEIVG